MPREVYERLQEEKELSLSQIGKSGDKADNLYNEHKRHFARVDRILDIGQHGPNWLAQSSVATIVWNKLHEFDGTHYELPAY